MDKSLDNVLKVAAEFDHWKNFAEFCKLEMAVGGPDPQIDLVAELCNLDSCSWEEKAWRGLCYIGVYNVPAAERIWLAWPFERAAREPGKFLSWFTENWKGIVLRRERKSARSPIKMAKCFETASGWLCDLIARKSQGRGWISGKDASSAVARYELAQDDVQNIYTVGRYVSLKFLEYGIRHLGFPIELRDIRAKGGWSPRLCLALLWPKQASILLGGDSQEEISVVDECVDKTISRLKIDNGLNVSHFNIQVLLCEYRECYVGKRQFPGRSHDSELSYLKKMDEYWGSGSRVAEARKRIFPQQALGEINGWPSVREELGHVLYDYGYMWSDLIYDYNQSKEFLKIPVKQGETRNKDKKQLLWENSFGKFIKKR